MSDKGTVCNVGKDEAKGEEVEESGGRGVSAAAEWNRQASTPLVFSTSQSKATMCEKSILQTNPPLHTSSLGEKKKHMKD